MWRDAAPEAARTTPSTAFSALRRDLGDVFSSDGYFVALLPECFSTDSMVFDEALRERCGHTMFARLRPGHGANLARLETVLDSASGTGCECVKALFLLMTRFI